MNLVSGIITVIFGFITVMVVVTSFFSYKEKELMLKQGSTPEVIEKLVEKDNTGEPKTKLANLRSGITLIAVGGAITIGLSFLDPGPLVIGGLIPLFLGIGRLILYYLLPND